MKIRFGIAKEGRRLKYWWQRRTRGFDDSELWNLDATVSEFMLPRLREFAKRSVARPVTTTDDEWRNIMAEMIWFLEAHTEEYFDRALDETDRYNKAGALFGKYFGALWW